MAVAIHWGVCLNACWDTQTPHPGCGIGDPSGCRPADTPSDVGLETSPGVGLEPPGCGSGNPPGVGIETPQVWAWCGPLARPLNFPPPPPRCGPGDLPPGDLQGMLGYHL